MVQRKPITTVTNRRNVDNNPEFLDTETLLLRFEPLIRSIQRQFLAWNGIFANQADKDDLYQQIVTEFLRLRKSYDPKRGVDFTGYVQFHLKQRVYHYVMKKQKVTQREQIARIYDDEDTTEDETSNPIDESVFEEFEYVEAMASVPWDDLNESQVEIMTLVFIEHKTATDIAHQRGCAIKAVKQEIEDLCDLFIAKAKEDYYD